MNSYIERVLADVKRRDKNEPEFLQTVEEVLSSLEVVVDQHPEYEKAGLLERLVEPERVIEFRVPWVDDQGKVRVNRGFNMTRNNPEKKELIPKTCATKDVAGRRTPALTASCRIALTRFQAPFPRAIITIPATRIVKSSRQSSRKIGTGAVSES